MKTIFKTMIALLAVGSLLVSSCKKGENDPFLSLKSRKSRVVGEWKMTAGTLKETQTTGSFTTTTTTTYTETTKTEVEVSGSSTTTDVYNYTSEITFDKEGTSTQKTVETQTSADGTEIPSNFQSTVTSELKSNWSFIGKNKNLDQKKKEGIVFAPSSTSTTTVTSSGTTSSSMTLTGYYPLGLEVWMIDRLKNKEMILKGSYNLTSSGSSTTVEYEYTLTAK